MLKKSLIVLSIFCLIVFSSSLVFASNMVHSAENALMDVGNGVKNVVNGAGNTVEHAKDGVSNMMNDMGNAASGFMDDTNNGDGYSASRTAATRSAAPASNTSFVWIILAIAAILIVALVWYYGTQTTKKSNH